jgi:ubiquinone/menaquinone biosynthesis C-methylase UbiE
MSELLRNPVFQTEEERTQQRSVLHRRAAQARQFIRQAPEGNAYPDSFEGLDPDELLYLGERVLHAGDIGSAYAILAQKPAIPHNPNDTYYDRLIGIQHRRAYEALRATIGQVQPHSERMIDIAAGTGEVGLAAAPKAREVLAVDIVPSLLSVADAKLTAAGVKHQIIEMNAVALDLPANYADFAATNALGPYINGQEYIQMMLRLHRILRPGGAIYEYSAVKPKPNPTYSLSPRGELARTIAQVLLQKTEMENPQKNAMDPTPLIGRFSARKLPLTGAPYPEHMLVFQKLR